jgi:lipid-binding SYLF domain-containing protein
MIAAAALGAAARPAAASDERDALEVVATYKQKHKALPKAFADAHGYAVFPNVGKGGLGLGAAHGNGWVYERGALVGRSSLHQLTIGLQLGGQSYSEVVLFQTRDAFEDFKRGKLKLDAQASAIALNARASADLAYRNGVAIITMAKGGLMYEASVGGQKFSFKPLDGDR